MRQWIDDGHPAFIGGNLIMPLFVVCIVIGSMVIEDIFADQYKFIDPFVLHQVCDFAPQGHDVIVDAVVPLADQLDDCVPEFVICVKDLEIQGRAAKFIPLRMDIVVVDGIGKIEFVIVPSVQRGALIFRGYVCISPLEIRLYIVHPAKIQDSGVGIGRNRYYYTFVNKNMRVHKPFIITIVGPESSGKTTLARELASLLGCPWVPEYAREYLEGLGSPYEVGDLGKIAERQMEAILSASSQQSASGNFMFSVGTMQLVLEQRAIVSFQKEVFGEYGRPVLIVDSGMLTLRMWARIKYGTIIPLVEEALHEDITSMYLLCRPLPKWEADPLREAPLLLDRAWIYNHYLEELATIQLR